jgi:hypothetical protein
MPLLSELKQFKASFGNIGREKADLEAKKIPFDDLELPDTEPDLSVLQAKAEEAQNKSDEAEDDAFDLDSTDTESDINPIDDLDFDAFLDSQPDDLPDVPLDGFPDITEDDAFSAEPPGAEIPDAEPPDIEDFGDEEIGAEIPDFPQEPDTAVPDEDMLISNFDGSGSLDFPDEPSPAESDDDLNFDNLDDLGLPDEQAATDTDEDLNLDDLGGFGQPDEQTATGADEDLNSLGSFDQPDEQATTGIDEDLNLDSLGGFGQSDEQAAISTDDDLDLDSLGSFGQSDEQVATGTDDDLDLDSLGGFDQPDEQAATDTDEDLNLDSLGGFDQPDEQAATDTDEDLDLDSLGSFGQPDEQATAGTADDLDLDNLGGFDQPDEQAAAGTADDLDLDNLGGFDLPDEQAAADSGDDLDLDNLGDFDQPDEQVAADSGGDLDLDNLGGFDQPDEQAAADGGEDLDLGNLDGLNFDDEATAPSFDDEQSFDDSSTFDDGQPADDENFVDLGTESEIETSPGSESDGMDEFSFPDLDSVLQESQKTTAFDTSSKDTKGKRRGKEKPQPEYKPPENVDEIKLSEAELARLQKTLSGYPLNLRIACEEIIAEEVVEPEKLSKLIRHLINGSPAKETALLAGHILGRIISIPKGFEKSSGEALEAEQASFAYIFVHNFLPILRLLGVIAVLVVSLFFLIYTFIYLPGKAESIYKQGYERIFAGEYQQANVRFSEAFDTHRKKDWFYKYAEAFRDERQYIYAEQKYDELLRYYFRDKKGILDYANLETYYLRNYAKADSLLRRQLLDYAPNDYDGLLAVGDNSLIWGEVDPSKYEDARYAFARVMDKYGWKDPVVERMMLYFIRTDDLGQVIYLRQWFDENKKRKMSANTLAELGGYFLDKQLEEVRGVPNEYLEYIDRVRDLLQEAIQGNPALPESYYHLARYYNRLSGVEEERSALEYAIRAFDNAPEESIRRLNYRIDTHQRYADLLINSREFIPAEEQLVRGINLYEDAISRRLMSRSPQYGRLYSGLGDLEYFTKIGDMEAALRFYRRAEQNGYAPPEMQYRMGSAYYQLEDWRNALEYLFTASSSLPLNDRVLFALGNTALKRGDYFASNGYYNRLINILEGQRVRLPSLLPSDRPDYLELAERLMMARNNAGVACEMLAAQTGNRSYITRAMALYAEAERAWDSRTRDPASMIRSGSTPLPYLNMRNALYPRAEYEPQIFIRIDREASEYSPWEKLAPIAFLNRSRSN